jgi:hypothetical protein
MTGAIIQVILGLFIWMVLPGLIYKKRKYQRNTPQFFVHLSCKIVGIAIIVFAVLNFIRSLLSI